MDDSHGRITIPEMNILPLTLRRFHCSNWEHFRATGAKPQGATINYDGVMPQSIYYAAHRMSPQMIHLRCREADASRCEIGHPLLTQPSKQRHFRPLPVGHSSSGAPGRKKIIS
ncbi:hypothetical protein V1477_002351, partial [Vespula maculifrons]